MCVFREISSREIRLHLPFSANWGKRDRVSKTLIHFKSGAFAAVADAKAFSLVHLTIIPRAPMGSESIAHEGERKNCFSKIHLVGQKYRDKTTSASKTRFSRHCFGFQSRRFSLLVGYNISPSSSSTNQNAALIIDR